MIQWVLAATLVCSVATVFASRIGNSDNPSTENPVTLGKPTKSKIIKDPISAALTKEHAEVMKQLKEVARASYGENKEITNGNYDRSLAVKCVNGTFVGRKAGNTIAYRGIPFVGSQPVGELRWKAPVDVISDDGVYEAYYNGKCAPPAVAKDLAVSDKHENQTEHVFGCTAPITRKAQDKSLGADEDLQKESFGQRMMGVARSVTEH